MSSSGTEERVFQDDIIRDLVSQGWVLGSPEGYNRQRALYEQDLLGFIKETQETQWEKFCKLYPSDPEEKLLDRVVQQLTKADPNAADRTMRTFGTLGLLRNELKDRGTRFRLVQFKPEHGLNPETLNRYEKNRLRVVPELVYSPWATKEQTALTGKKAKPYRIDLVLFVNGIPVITMELKSEFKQSVQNAVKQYKTTRHPVDPATRKAEPLLTFKRGALVHFAVSQTEVYMTTRLAGRETFFLPFNKGTKEGAAGNDIPEDINRYATDYLWNEVLLPENLLNILARFFHLEIKEKENYEGRKYKKETLIFPRYHQWDVVRKLIDSASAEGPGQKYLIQHSAGSGKSNSIAWTAHQLSSLHQEDGNKLFASVIVVTDRTVLDDQLQDTIYQFDHQDGVVGRINRKDGGDPKSEQLATALESAQPIIIVTIQTFPFVLKAIENNVSLKERNYAIIADEAHSSQTGKTARELKEVLMIDGSEEELTQDEIINATLEARRGSGNLSYFAFTATPKPKTLELFGRLPHPEAAPSKENKPLAFHVYSMRQAIEEGFILDVLKNYTNYATAYRLAQKVEEEDQTVDEKKARVKLNQWMRLHDYNISQKVMVVVEHFRDNVQHLLNGQAKAMVVTGSRKEAVRYKICFDKYIRKQGYTNLTAMVAFSGEVEFDDNDPNAASLVGTSYTESSMNPDLRGREMRKAFDSEDYQVMIVANKFQTGFDQPKLCAMYVDKKLNGVECVQTLSRLNRTYPGKAGAGTYILDFFNDPQDILDAFQPYYQTAELLDVSDPNQITDLFEKLKASGIFLWQEVEQFSQFYYQKKTSQAALQNSCKPAVDRWKHRYKIALSDYKTAKEMLERTKKTKEPVLIANAENRLKEAKIDKDFLELFKKDLGTYVRQYEFLSQIVDYSDSSLEKLSSYARELRPMLRESLDDDPIDLYNVELSHYRLSKIRQQNLKLSPDGDFPLEPSGEFGSGRPRDKKEDRLSHIIEQLNDMFDSDGLTDDDMVNYAHTVKDKVRENERVMIQLANNPDDRQILHGDLPDAVIDAILESSEVHKNLQMQLLSNDQKVKRFTKLILNLLREAV